MGLLPVRASDAPANELAGERRFLREFIGAAVGKFGWGTHQAV